MVADNDIVDRLRALSRCEHSDLSVGDEAAAEIVRLRGELALAAGWHEESIAPAETARRLQPDGIHTCNYQCDQPECIRAQRDELAAWFNAQPADGEAVAWVCSPTENIAKHIGITSAERQRLIDNGFDVSHYRPLVYGDTTPPAAQVQQPEEYAEGPTWTHNGQRISLVNGQLLITRNGKIEFIGAAQAQPSYTTGHCENHRRPGGCPMHNLQCGYPECDRKPTQAAHPSACELGALPPAEDS